MVENCSQSHPIAEGTINTRGAWLRSKSYGRRYIERKERTFCSNPTRSMSAGQFSPIPKGLISKMANMNLNKNGDTRSPHNTPKSGHQKSPTQHYKQQSPTSSLMIHKSQTLMQPTICQFTPNQEENHKVKRKLEPVGQMVSTTTTTQEFGMAGLSNKAKQQL